MTQCDFFRHSVSTSSGKNSTPSKKKKDSRKNSTKRRSMESSDEEEPPRKRQSKLQKASELHFYVSVNFVVLGLRKRLFELCHRLYPSRGGNFNYFCSLLKMKKYG